LGGLSDDFEWHAIPDWPGTDIARGPREVVDYFRDDVREMFPDWRGRIESISELAPGIYFNHLVMEGVGRAGGVPTTTDLFQIWEMDGRRPVRVREFLRREEALAAAGTEAPETRAPGR
jgi:hypothetical protein